MLFITTKTREIEWHVGDPWPLIDGRVITFQADGHELEFMLEILRDATEHGPDNIW